MAVVKGIRQEFGCLFLFGFYRIVDFSFFFLHCHVSRGHLPSLLICICCLSLHFHCCFLLTSFYGVDIVNDQMLAPDVGLHFSVSDFCLCFICVLWFPLLFFIDCQASLVLCTHRLAEAVRALLIGNWSLWYSVSILEVMCGFICILWLYILGRERLGVRLLPLSSWLTSSGGAF